MSNLTVTASSWQAQGYSDKDLQLRSAMPTVGGIQDCRNTAVAGTEIAGVACPEA